MIISELANVFVTQESRTQSRSGDDTSDGYVGVQELSIISTNKKTVFTAANQSERSIEECQDNCLLSHCYNERVDTRDWNQNISEVCHHLVWTNQILNKANSFRVLEKNKVL